VISGGAIAGSAGERRLRSRLDRELRIYQLRGFLPELLASEAWSVGYFHESSPLAPEGDYLDP